MKPFNTASRIFSSLLICLSFASFVNAERTPVLRQIHVPHDYYFREMYLPQVSSGPQNPVWSPDGRQLIYAMQGSLWKQSIDSTLAIQLTSGPGYDHQPDWSPDGRQVIFARYFNDAMELQLLDLKTGTVSATTDGGHVNLDPRWSPDGEKIAYVSTAQNGRFHVFTGKIKNGKLGASPVTSERMSETGRYYYSPFDHEISPTWTPDGEALLYVSNPEIPYGTGAIWHHSLNGSTEPALVRKEETTWRAHPDIAPDGQRVVYSSYLGRQWHQLWITSLTGKGEPFPLTYGDYDVSNARWSPRGDRIAFAVNETGNTSLRILSLPGGKVVDLEIAERQYLHPTGSLSVTVTDGDDTPASARLSVVGEDGKTYGPHDSWLHADDSFDRSQRSAEARYFHVDGETEIELPAGRATVTVWKGVESHIQKIEVVIAANKKAALDIILSPLQLPGEWLGWQSGDVHVHMNYGGIYRNTPENLVRQGDAEDLDLIFNLIVNKEQRIPDHRFFSGTSDDASNASVVLQHSQEFHTGYWGHLGILGLSEHLLLPDYSAYPETAAASLYPDNATVEDLAHEQGALVGYVHPFAYPLPDPATDAALTNALPIDAALGKVDFYEVVGFADHRASAEIWYRLLNCGLRISAAGGTDAMANYASLRGPVGMNRTFVQVDDWPLSPDERGARWMEGLKAGRSLATNGPLLGFNVDGQGPGSELDISGSREVNYKGFLRSSVPINKLEVVWNGEVIETIDLGDDAGSADFSSSVVVQKSGWLLLRASSDEPHRDIFDMYPYATTSPVYVNVDGLPPYSRKDAEYFLAWIARVRDSAATHADYNSESEREAILQNIDDAAAVYRR